MAKRSVDNSMIEEIDIPMDLPALADGDVFKTVVSVIMALMIWWFKRSLTRLEKEHESCQTKTEKQARKIQKLSNELADIRGGLSGFSVIFEAKGLSLPSAFSKYLDKYSSINIEDEEEEEELVNDKPTFKKNIFGKNITID